MAITYTQTDTNAPLGVIQACASTAPAADADAKEAIDGGTAGTTALTCGVANASQELCYADELRISDTDSLDGGTLTHRLNVSTSQANLTLEDIFVCRVNSSGVSQETLGSATNLGTDISAGGVFTTNITLSAASAHNAGDRVYITVVVANSHDHTSRTIEVLPDQNIDTPFTVGAQTHQGSASDGTELGDTTSARIDIQDSGTDGIELSDVANEDITAPVAGSDGAQLGDSATASVFTTHAADGADGLDMGDSAVADVLLLHEESASDGLDVGDSATASVSLGPAGFSTLTIRFS